MSSALRSTHDDVTYDVTPYPGNVITRTPPVACSVQAFRVTRSGKLFSAHESLLRGDGRLPEQLYRPSDAVTAT